MDTQTALEVMAWFGFVIGFLCGAAATVCFLYYKGRMVR
jgi:hypothetical protein